MRVVLVGHSQVHKEVECNGYTLECCRLGGAYIGNAYHDPIAEYIESGPDAIFVWLGGNDLAKFDAYETVEQLLELVTHIRQYTTNVWLLNVENRDYRSEFTTTYMREAAIVNRRLTQIAHRRHLFRTINVAGRYFAAGAVGIHFGRHGMRLTLNKIRNAITYAVQQGDLEF